MKVSFKGCVLLFLQITWNFQKNWSWILATSFCLFPGFLIPDHISFIKYFWPTNKMIEVGQLQLQLFWKLEEIFEPYQCVNTIKIRRVMIKWIFEKIRIFNFFLKNVFFEKNFEKLCFFEKKIEKIVFFWKTKLKIAITQWVNGNFFIGGSLEGRFWVSS